MRKSQFLLTTVDFLGCLLIMNLAFAIFAANYSSRDDKDIPRAADAQTSVSLTIRTQYNNGQPLTGMWTVLRAQNGATLATGYSPVIFNLAANQQYSVAVSNYQQILFDTWSDNTKTASHPVKIAQSTTFLALYKPVPKLNQRAIADSLHPIDAIQSRVVRPAKNLNVGLSETISSQDSIQTSAVRAPLPQVFARDANDSIQVTVSARAFLSHRMVSMKNPPKDYRLMTQYK